MCCEQKKKKKEKKTARRGDSLSAARDTASINFNSSALESRSDGGESSNARCVHSSANDDGWVNGYTVRSESYTEYLFIDVAGLFRLKRPPRKKIHARVERPPGTIPPRINYPTTNFVGDAATERANSAN